MVKAIALIPARAGSTRVKLKNIRPLGGHPLIAYAIAGALEAGIFDRVVVSTDSPQIAEVARHYGAEAPFLRPAHIAAEKSPDIEWVLQAFEALGPSFDIFSILRPTSPFRTGAAIRSAYELLLDTPEADSVRHVRACREHPGKMWTLDEGGTLMRPLLDQTGWSPPMHSRQYQDLPKVYVQTSALEIAWARVVTEGRTIAGAHVAPIVGTPEEGFSVDYEDDWTAALRMLKAGVPHPKIKCSPYPEDKP